VNPDGDGVLVVVVAVVVLIVLSMEEQGLSKPSGTCDAVAVGFGGAGPGGTCSAEHGKARFERAYWEAFDWHLRSIKEYA
jgi:hypothetical protein